MKKAPSKPQITPKKIAAGKSSIEFSSYAFILPNFKEPESDKLSGLASPSD
jgi:hypothetical protein